MESFTAKSLGRIFVAVVMGVIVMAPAAAFSQPQGVCVIAHPL